MHFISLSQTGSSPRGIYARMWGTMQWVRIIPHWGVEELSSNYKDHNNSNSKQLNNIRFHISTDRTITVGVRRWLAMDPSQITLYWNWLTTMEFRATIWVSNSPNYNKITYPFGLHKLNSEYTTLFSLLELGQEMIFTASPFTRRASSTGLGKRSIHSWPTKMLSCWNRRMAIHFSSEMENHLEVIHII